MNKLLPCPFCGSKEYQPSVEFDGHYNTYNVLCQNCSVSGRDEYTRKMAIESWNKRVHNKNNDYEQGYMKAIQEMLENIHKMESGHTKTD